VPVIGKLQGSCWRVIIGVGVGQLDGGFEADVEEDELPATLRFPNAEFWVAPSRQP
jgi:hypothetical protein